MNSFQGFYHLPCIHFFDCHQNEIILSVFFPHSQLLQCCISFSMTSFISFPAHNHSSVFSEVYISSISTHPYNQNHYLAKESFLQFFPFIGNGYLKATIAPFQAKNKHFSTLQCSVSSRFDILSSHIRLFHKKNLVSWLQK